VSVSVASADHRGVSAEGEDRGVERGGPGGRAQGGPGAQGAAS